jgi:putative transposase
MASDKLAQSEANVQRLLCDNDHKGLVNAAMLCFQGSQWQRCQFHFGRNVRKYLPRRKHRELHRRLRSIWDAPDRETAHMLLQNTLDYYSGYRHLCDWLENNVEDCLAVFNLPPEHRTRLRTTNGVERMHEEVKRRTLPIRIFPNRESALRMITSIW